MKKLLLPLLASTPLMALPLNNPIEPRLFERGAMCTDYCDSLWCDMNLRFGFYGDYIFNTHMKVDRPGATPTVHSVRVMTNAGEIDLNWKCLDVFATLGATKIFVESSIVAFQTAGVLTNSLIDIDLESAFSWSVGGRWAVLEWGCWGFGIEGQYFRTKPDINYVREYSFGIPRYLNGQSATYSSWQVGAGVNYHLMVGECISLNPYAGAFWVDNKLNLGSIPLTTLIVGTDQNVTLFELEKDRQYGWAFGLTMALGDFSTITAEGRWGGEKAAFLNFQVQY